MRSNKGNVWDTPEWSYESVILLSITTLGTLVVLYTRNDFFVAFSVAWGWIGIGVQQFDDVYVSSAAFTYGMILIVSGLYCIYYINDQRKYLPIEKEIMHGEEVL